MLLAIHLYLSIDSLRQDIPRACIFVLRPERCAEELPPKQRVKILKPSHVNLLYIDLLMLSKYSGMHFVKAGIESITSEENYSPAKLVALPVSAPVQRLARSLLLKTTTILP